MKTPSADYITKEEARTRAPAELFHVWTDLENWYFTNGDAAIVYGGHTYVPATIQRDEVRHNAELEVSTMTLRVAALKDPVIQYIAGNPVETLWIEVLHLFRDLLTETQVVFAGQVKSVTFKGPEAVVECVGLEVFMSQPIPRFRYQPGCNNQIYDDFCGLSKATYTHSITLATVSSDGLTLTSAGFDALADGYFLYGEIVYQSHRRMVVYHTGDTVKLQYRISGLADGHVVSAIAGCDWKYDTCNSRFSNTNNFFGMRYIPIRNPAVQLQ